MAEITASDLTHLPHIIIVKRKGEAKRDIIEYSDAIEAHKDAYSLLTEDVTEVFVCARLRHLHRLAPNN